MRHRSARRLLPQLLDGTLPSASERGVREHAACCGRCRRDLADFELCDQLVTRLPHRIIPLIEPALGERRLAGLASWAFPRPVPRRRWLVLEGLAAAAAAGALAGVVALAGAASWVPTPASTPGGYAQTAYVTPGLTPR
jgi:anti-sigma factor RsiW